MTFTKSGKAHKGMPHANQGVDFVFFFVDFIYIPGHVSTTKAGRPWPLHEARGGFELIARMLSARSRSLIKGDNLKLDLL